MQSQFAKPVNLNSANGPIVTPSFEVDDTNGDAMVRIVGHVVDDPGLLSYANSLEGDHGVYQSGGPDQFAQASDQYTTIQRGQDNDHLGFCIDNVIIGFAERGEMVTNAPVNTAFNTPAAKADVLTSGAYQLQIREASAYGIWAHRRPCQCP